VTPTATPTPQQTANPITYPGSQIPPGVLSPSAPPGTNFNLSLWELQEPVAGATAGSVNTVTSAQLAAGYTDAYFLTDPSNGAMEFWDPEDGVTTTNSSYPRSELREMTAGGLDANWPVSGTNTLTATVSVLEVPTKVVIGQIHAGTTGTPATTLPLLELYYESSGAMYAGVEQSPTASGEDDTQLGTVALGKAFTYVISLTGTGASAVLSVSINGTVTKIPFPASFANETMYFKAGDYDQTPVGTSSTIGAKVEFFGLAISHS